MAWVAVDKDGTEIIGPYLERDSIYWKADLEGFTRELVLPNGTIKKLIGRELTWEDEPVKLK